MVEANSLERIVDYFPIPHEPSFDASRTPPASWPTSGSIVVEDLTARYSDTGSPVLKGLSFSVRSGEKIGVVGRTGGQWFRLRLLRLESETDLSFVLFLSQLVRALWLSLCFDWSLRKEKSSS